MRLDPTGGRCDTEIFRDEEGFAGFKWALALVGHRNSGKEVVNVRGAWPRGLRRLLHGINGQREGCHCNGGDCARETGGVGVPASTLDPCWEQMAPDWCWCLVEEIRYAVEDNR